MRILIAVDGSDPSAIACDLVAGSSWPIGTTIRVVYALEAGGSLFGAPWYAVAPSNADEIEERYLRDAEGLVARWAAKVGGLDREVGAAVIRGRAATAIVDEARRFGADLLVVGSRGFGGLEMMLLGSVSAEVVDHAPCPVLVARRPTTRRVVLADDGSAGARAAAEKLIRWSPFSGARVTVVSVASARVPWEPAYPTRYDPTDGEYVRQDREAALEAHRHVAEEAAARLRLAGCEADADVRTGHAAQEIVRVAQEQDADLVIVGTRGHTGLSRLLLGSVARNVLTHVHCSVLVVRERASARPRRAVPEGATADTADHEPAETGTRVA